MSDEQSIEEEIARTLSVNWNNMHTNESLGRQRMLANSLSPLLNRVRAEALLQGMHMALSALPLPDEDARSGMIHARGLIAARLIEQNSEGNET